MKSTHKALLVATLSLTTSFLTGCGEEVHTVEWYTAHKAERKAMVDKCNSNPGQLDATPNCQNAKKSRQINSFRGPMPKGY